MNRRTFFLGGSLAVGGSLLALSLSGVWLARIPRPFAQALFSEREYEDLLTLVALYFPFIKKEQCIEVAESIDNWAVMLGALEQRVVLVALRLLHTFALPRNFNFETRRQHVNAVAALEESDDEVVKESFQLLRGIIGIHAFDHLEIRQYFALKGGCGG